MNKNKTVNAHWQAKNKKGVMRIKAIGVLLIVILLIIMALIT